MFHSWCNFRIENVRVKAARPHTTHVLNLTIMECTSAITDVCYVETAQHVIELELGHSDLQMRYQVNVINIIRWHSGGDSTTLILIGKRS